jgi:4-alpha-glucanotransferase
LRHLAESPARLVVLNLEDVWFETRPQNIPGTSTERPNWRRKAMYAFEEFSRMPDILTATQIVTKSRYTEERPHEHDNSDS